MPVQILYIHQGQFEGFLLQIPFDPGMPSFPYEPPNGFTHQLEYKRSICNTMATKDSSIGLLKKDLLCGHVTRNRLILTLKLITGRLTGTGKTKHALGRSMSCVCASCVPFIYLNWHWLTSLHHTLLMLCSLHTKHSLQLLEQRTSPEPESGSCSRLREKETYKE